MDKYYSTDSFCVRHIANQILLFPLGSTADKLQGAIAIDEIAEFIWTELKQPKTISELITIICTQYDTGDEDITLSVMDLLNFFLSYGVIARYDCV
jgi:hypothetical protein